VNWKWRGRASDGTCRSHEFECTYRAESEALLKPLGVVAPMISGFHCLGRSTAIDQRHLLTCVQGGGSVSPRSGNREEAAQYKGGSLRLHRPKLVMT
jgi:hypothetical protein